jgi:hypothetical protein
MSLNQTVRIRIFETCIGTELNLRKVVNLEVTYLLKGYLRIIIKLSICARIISIRCWCAGRRVVLD